MRFPLVRFVDGPSDEAVVRYDFNDDAPGAAATFVLADGWSVGAPTLDGDPDSVGVQYGTRKITLTQEVHGPKGLALRRQSELAGELLRRRNWLMFQLDPFTLPVWFHTYRSEPGDLKFDQVYTDSLADRWAISVSLTADAFAYGARVVLPPVVYGNQTGATAKFLQAELPAVSGDAPTALRVEVTPGAGIAPSAVGDITSWMVHVAAAETSAAAAIFTHIGTGDGWTSNAGVTASPPAAYIGGSARYQSAEATVAEFYGTFNVPTGRYKLLMHAASGNGSNLVDVSTRVYQWHSDGADGQGLKHDPRGPVTLPAYSSGGERVWVDLGDLSFPAGVVPLPADVAPSTVPSYVTVQVTRPANGSMVGLLVDGFLLVPLDGPQVRGTTQMLATFTQGGLGSTVGATWDGDDEVTWLRTLPAGTVRPGSPTEAGGYPVAYPGAVNVLTVFPAAADHAGSPPGSTVVVTDPSATWTVTASFYPRWLYIGGGS